MVNRILVCGGRDYTNKKLVYKVLNIALEAAYDSDEEFMIIQGGAKGADFLAAQWAKDHEIECIQVNADWKTYGKAAGSIRNQLMIDSCSPTLIIAFPGGTGTNDMINKAKKAGIPTAIVPDRLLLT